ncbi:predicted protein [Chaetoceros tenuissimus]|uniref:Uncharacterized protein n=1 Tax=Chaetoceros tenuissimus TaxID=426638 RepID=A0AAD3CCX8_9STRA|nr:predicted protein [Chaetoceros tenuissimus]
MLSYIANTNASSNTALNQSVLDTDGTRNALNALTLSDKNNCSAVTTSSSKNMYSSLMDSTTLGLQEIANSVISELQKDPKKKEVVVHVRVMRLCRDKNKNKNKKCYTKAKITKLSYRLKVNQKVLQKMIKKQESIRKVSI